MSKKTKKINKMKKQFELLFCNQCGASISTNDPLFLIELTNAFLCSSHCLQIFQRFHPETAPGRFTVRYYEPATAAPVIFDEFSEITNEIWKAADVLKKLRNERKKDAPEIVIIQTDHANDFWGASIFFDKTEHPEPLPRFWDNTAPGGEFTATTKVNSETTKDGGATRNDEVKFESIEFADEKDKIKFTATASVNLETGKTENLKIENEFFAQVMNLERQINNEIGYLENESGVAFSFLRDYFEKLMRLIGRNGQIEILEKVTENAKQGKIKASFDPNAAGRENLKKAAARFLDSGQIVGEWKSERNLSDILTDFFISAVDEFRPKYISESELVQLIQTEQKRSFHCFHCGREDSLNRFYFDNLTFCSTQCRATYSETEPERTCDGCGKTFTGGAFVNADGVFCWTGCAVNTIDKQSVAMRGGAEMETELKYNCFICMTPCNKNPNAPEIPPLCSDNCRLQFSQLDK